MLRAAGATCWRVGFNRGDAVFWGEPASYIPFTSPQANWAATFATLIEDKSVTDIVLYGDTRRVHAEAVRIAQARGLTIHVFEEGYLRPYWVSYERGGSNGNSRLMHMPVAEMRAALAGASRESPVAPAHWGDMRHHIFYGALYHFFVMFANRRYRGFRPHRDIPVTREFGLYLRGLLLMPTHAVERRLATRAVIHGGFPYHLVLLQLAHDASFTAHSPFASVSAFLDTVIAGFAAGAPRHHHLVFKAHPLEDGREPLAREIRRLAAEHDVAGRVHHLRGGKLARLLDQARSAVTVNSTAAQQVLWRGLPIRTFGRAVYAKPEFVSTQPLPAFFARPTRPDTAAYRDFRAYLLETSQVAGGFYAARARRQLMRQVVDMMLSPDDAYDALAHGTAAPRQRLRAVT
ncbi:MAG TPA: capsule biosynthesis protein CapA, partial [Rhodobacteraceae bacterium]|nr:capsule biosynthesis protein CapA [Paracoccaceae bacterium]